MVNRRIASVEVCTMDKARASFACLCHPAYQFQCGDEQSQKPTCACRIASCAVHFLAKS